MKHSFESDGCALVRNLLAPQDTASIDTIILNEIRVHLPTVTSIQDADWVQMAIENPTAVTAVYDAIRDHPSLLELGKNPKIVSLVKQLLDAPVLYNKIPLRIDVPFENKELAFWHQDDFYVQGNGSELTVWIPLQDTFAHTGALSVMKGSHTNGAIPHVYSIGKKMIPTGIFDNPINIMEMARGDALFFDSYTVHSSNLNVSDQIRYSVQLRYSCANAGNHSTRMKGITNVQ